MKTIITFILLSCALVVFCSNRIVYKSVKYPVQYDSNQGVKGNLLYSVLIHEDGTVYTVGNNSNYIVYDQQYLNPRVIRKFKISKHSVEKFENDINNAGFMDLPLVKESNRTKNVICDTFKLHEVCHPAQAEHAIISQIKNGLITLISSHTHIVNYSPIEIMVKTIKVPVESGVHAYTVDHNTHRDFEKGKIVKNSNPLYKTIMEGVNNGYTYFDGITRFQFVVSIKELSVFEIPSGDGMPNKKINDDFVVGVVFFLVVSFLMLFFSIVVILIIKKKLKNYSHEESISISLDNEEKSSSIDQENNNFSQNTYPVIIQTPNIPNYPVFVPANTQNNALYFQPQVYYPVNTQL